MKKSHLHKNKKMMSSIIASLSSSTSKSSSTPISATSSSATTTTTTVDNIANIKIENATEELPYTCFNYLANRVLPRSRGGKENVLTICDYVSSLRSEINPAERCIFSKTTSKVQYQAIH